MDEMHDGGYRALRILEKECPPLRGRPARQPYWRPRPAPPARVVHIPAWAWASDGLMTAAQVVTVDANAAYLSAAAGVTVAHGPLERTGPLTGPATSVPGYYQISTHQWATGSIHSPLGTATVDARVWVAHPTLGLLQALAEDGYWPQVQVHDSWTCAYGVRLSRWTSAVRDDRAAALRDVSQTPPKSADHAAAQRRYEAIKLSYCQAIQLMATGDKSRTHRPDWAHAIQAQHRASMWRKAWHCVLAGVGPVAAGSVDELKFDHRDFARIAELVKPPIRIDQTGRSLGSFKVKRVESEARR